jgi:hypothetical protein
MTCILTPDGAPFFAGTYFPRVPQPGLPAFRQVLAAVSQAWRDRREEINRIGSDVTAYLRQLPQPESAASEDVTAQAVDELTRSFDDVHGGFGRAPKFPPSMICEFLLRHAARRDDAHALDMVERTLEAMARGGIYDQLGGGFARYSVDDRWDVPHFEKMLYDNAQLLRLYAHWHRQTGNPLAARVARETAGFMIRELGTAGGAFASALDADSDGAEGVFYVWTPEQLDDVLGTDDGAFARRVFGLREGGNFEHGTSTLRLDQDPEPGETHRLADVRRRLLDARDQRTRPARDDKVVAAWNGLAIAALTEAGMILDEPDFVAAATAAAAMLVEVHFEEGRLRRVSRDGRAGRPAGVLEDYACLADGMLTLFGATGEARWYAVARDLVDAIEAHFADGDGGFFDTADDAETLLKRPQDSTDTASPSGQSMTLTVLTTMHGLTGADRFSAAAERLANRLSGLAQRAPRFAGQTLCALEAMLDGPRQVAVVGEDDDGRADLLRAAHRLVHPGLVVAVGDGNEATVPLLESRPLLAGRATAYSCQHFVCDLPVTDPAALR